MDETLIPIGQRVGAYPGVVPYLVVTDAKALITFLEQGFGARLRFSMPAPAGKTMHAEVELGDALVMVSDASETPHAPIDLCHYVTDVDAVYARALAAGAESIRPPQTEDYGDRTAGVKDGAGNTWWICARVA